MSSGTWQETEAEKPDPLPSRKGLLSGIFVLIVVVGLLAVAVAGETPTASAEIGAKAPDFEVVTFEGEEFVLSEHIRDDGRPVLINLWASWCPPCRLEIPSISNWAEANPDVYVIGVAVEDVETSARQLAVELEPFYDLAMGNDEFRAAYPSLGLPASFVTDSDGRITNIVSGIVNEDSLDEIFAPLT